MDYEIEKLVQEHMTQRLKGRKLLYDDTTAASQFIYGGTRWTWLTAEQLDTATHEVVSASFSFGRHYCPSEEQYSYDPGEPTYEVHLTVRDLKYGKEITREFNMSGLPSD